MIYFHEIAFQIGNMYSENKKKETPRDREVYLVMQNFVERIRDKTETDDHSKRVVTNLLFTEMIEIGYLRPDIGHFLCIFKRYEDIMKQRYSDSYQLYITWLDIVSCFYLQQAIEYDQPLSKESWNNFLYKQIYLSPPGKGGYYDFKYLVTYIFTHFLPNMYREEESTNKFGLYPSLNEIRKEYMCMGGTCGQIE